jgi:hypothetical protein
VKRLLEFGPYQAHYKLLLDSVTIEAVPPAMDINKPGLLMHGSESEPYFILKFGLFSRETLYFKDFKSMPQICMGLNNTNKDHTIQANGSVKNTSVKYSNYFAKDGIIYILSDEVKKFITYREEWEDHGTYRRGIASISEPVASDLILGVITTNLPKIMAALTKARRKLPVYTPDGTEYRIK